MAAAQQPLFAGLASAPAEGVQYVGTTRAQLEPMLLRLAELRLLNGGHWVSPTAGHGEIPRLCAELLPKLGRPMPVQWTCYELADVPPPADADTWAHTVHWHSGHDLTRLINAHVRRDVAMVLENFPWGRGAPGLRSLVEHCWHLYPHAHVVALYAWERVALDWTRHGEDNAAWVAQHGPDVYMLGRGRNGMQTFSGSGADLNNLCGWLHWAPDRRNRDYTITRWL